MAATLLPMRSANTPPKTAIGESEPAGGGPMVEPCGPRPPRRVNPAAGEGGGVLVGGLHERGPLVLGPGQWVGEVAVAGAHLVVDRESATRLQDAVDLGEHPVLVGTFMPTWIITAASKLSSGSGRDSPGVARK